MEFELWVRPNECPNSCFTTSSNNPLLSLKYS